VTIKTYQFSCAVRIVETGELMPIEGLITPPVTTETPTAAIMHPDTVAYCEANKCSVYRMVK
jgi:hypothetical protein